MRRVTITVCLVLCLAAPVCLSESSAAEKAFYITVEAGSFDRRDAVAYFTLPNEARAAAYRLSDESGRMTPLQVSGDRQATFMLAELKAGATKKYRLEELRPDRAPSAEGVLSVRERDEIAITAAGRRVLRYQAQKGELPRADMKPIFRRGGYINTVYTPSGRIVTDDYPPKHQHHHGVWFAWTKTVFEGRHPDFWNMGDGSGTVEFKALDQTWSGPVHGGFKARHSYVDLSGPAAKAALNETWEVTVYRTTKGERPYAIFDLVSTQECATSSPLVLPEYHYGGVGFRGHPKWDGKENAFFLTSEGKDRSNGHGTRARWCNIGGRVDGQLAQIAILCHPSNFRAPQPMRIHPDEPFFCFAPSQMGDWEIAPGKPYVSRYRFIVYDGEPDAAEIERFWNDYANPPQVWIGDKAEPRARQ